MQKLSFSKKNENYLFEMEKNFEENKNAIEQLILDCLLPVECESSESMYFEDVEWDWDARTRLINHILGSKYKDNYFVLLHGKL